MNYGEDYTKYQVNRISLRFFIRNFYLKNILKFVKGKCIDFGCGSGDLLSRLPEGSAGTDINKSSIEYCRKNNLTAFVYNVEEDNYELKLFEPCVYDTLIFSHVLEHLENATEKIRILFASAQRLNIKRVIIVVPGIKGFAYDKTHMTYIDIDFIYKNKLDKLNGYEIFHKKYFPVNSKLFSKYFTHNELVIVYDNI